MAFLVLTGHPGCYDLVRKGGSAGTIRFNSYLIPITDTHAFSVGLSYLRTEQCQLCCVEVVLDRSKLLDEIGTGDGTDISSNV